MICTFVIVIDIELCFIELSYLSCWLLLSCIAVLVLSTHHMIYYFLLMSNYDFTSAGNSLLDYNPVRNFKLNQTNKTLAVGNFIITFLTIYYFLLLVLKVCNFTAYIKSLFSVWSCHAVYHFLVLWQTNLLTHTTINIYLYFIFILQFIASLYCVLLSNNLLLPCTSIRKLRLINVEVVIKKKEA